MTSETQILTLLHEHSRLLRKLADAPRKEIFSVDEAAEYLGITKQYLYELNSNNSIPHYKINGSKLVRYRKSDLDKWMNRSKVKSNDEIKIEAEKRSAKK